jgi:hypothetical protein
MGKRIATILASTVLALALAVPIVSVAQAPGAGEQGEKGEKAEKAERHPAIHAAIRNLQHAKEILQKEAARDFEGHRAKAVQQIDEALKELHLALQADKK